MRLCDRRYVLQGTAEGTENAQDHASCRHFQVCHGIASELAGNGGSAGGGARIPCYRPLFLSLTITELPRT